MNSFKLYLGTFLSIAVVASPAVAGSNSSTMVVSATVVENCTIAATPLAFGNVSPGSINFDSSATVALVCTPNADFDVLIGNGSNSSLGQRRLANLGSTEFIPYDLYMDAAHTQSWGNTVGTNTMAGVGGVSGIVNYTVYGRIPSTASPVGAGSYSDTVTVTVNF